MAGGLASTLVVLIVVFGVSQLLKGEDSAPANAGADTDSQTDEATDEGPDTQDVPEESATERPTPPPKRQFDCWSGQVKDSLADCGRPTGVQGLQWVFPDFSATRCEEQDARRKQMWTCDVTTATGSSVMVRYSEYTRGEVRSTFTRLNRKWVDQKEDSHTFGTSETRYIWHYTDVPDNAYPHVISWMYADHPFSVSIEGNSRSDIEEVLAGQAWRLPTQMRGISRQP